MKRLTNEQLEEVFNLIVEYRDGYNFKDDITHLNTIFLARLGEAMSKIPTDDNLLSEDFLIKKKALFEEASAWRAVIHQRDQLWCLVTIVKELFERLK